MPLVTDLQMPAYPPYALIVPSTNSEEARLIYEKNSDLFGVSLSWRGLQAAHAKFAAIENVGPDWNGGDSEAPDRQCKQTARWILDMAVHSGQLPLTSVLPSVEGGIALGFGVGLRQGSIEVLNSGELIAAHFDDRDEPQVWEFEPNRESAEAAIERIRVYMSS